MNKYRFGRLDQGWQPDIWRSPGGGTELADLVMLGDKMLERVNGGYRWGRRFPLVAGPYDSELWHSIQERAAAVTSLPIGQQKEAFTSCVVSQIPGWCMSSSYHTAYPNWDCPADVCHLFLFSFICAPTTAFTWLSKFCTLQLYSVFLPILGTLLVQGFIFERGPTIVKIV